MIFNDPNFFFLANGVEIIRKVWDKNDLKLYFEKNSFTIFIFFVVLFEKKLTVDDSVLQKKRTKKFGEPIYLDNFINKKFNFVILRILLYLESNPVFSQAVS